MKILTKKYTKNKNLDFVPLLQAKIPKILISAKLNNLKRLKYELFEIVYGKFSLFTKNLKRCRLQFVLVILRGQKGKH